MAWEKLKKLHDSRRLVSGKSTFIPLLQDALQGQQFYRLIESKNLNVFRIIFDVEKAPEFGKEACFEILETKPCLNSTESRKGLLQKLLGRPDNYSFPGYCKAIRYLLHGDPDF